MHADSLTVGDVVYAREHEGQYGVTTVARFENKYDEIVQDEKGIDRLVTYYEFWDLRRNKKITNPSSVWRTSGDYQGLRSSKKVKIFGDFSDEKEKKE